MKMISGHLRERYCEVIVQFIRNTYQILFSKFFTLEVIISIFMDEQAFVQYAVNIYIHAYKMLYSADSN